MATLSRRDFLKVAGISAASLAWLGRPQGFLAGRAVPPMWHAQGESGGLPGALYQAQRGSARYTSIDWSSAIAALKRILESYQPGEIVFLLGLFPDHVFDFVQSLAVALGGASVLRFGLQAEVDSSVTLRDAAQKLFGVSQIPYFDLWNSDVVFSFGAGNGESWLTPAPGAGAQGWSLPPRPVRGPHWVQFDALLSPAARQADEWVRVRPGSQALVAQALAQRVARLRGGALTGERPNGLSEAAALCGVGLAELERLARLFAGSQSPLAIPGSAVLGDRQGLAAAEAILSLNIHPLVGADGIRPTAGLYFTPQFPLCSASSARPSTLAEMTVLAERMRRGELKALLVHGADPVAELPESLGFLDALRQVEQVISLSPRLDATAAWADYILPDHPQGAGWGYQRAEEGCDRPALFALQPPDASQRDTRSPVDVLLTAARAVGGGLAAALPFASQLDFIKQTVYTLNPWGGAYQAGNVDEFWAAWQEHGGWWTPAPLRMPALALQGVGPTPVEVGLSQGDKEFPLRLLLFNQPEVAPTGQPTESPWIALSPGTAMNLGLKAGQPVEVRSMAGALQAVLRLDAALEPGSAAMPFWWGRGLPGAAVNEAGSLAWRHADVRCRAL